MHWRLFLCGALLLGIGSWIDNVRGPLLPILSQEFTLSQSLTGALVAAGNFFAMTSTWLLLPTLNRFSIKSAATVLLILTMLLMTAAYFVESKMLLLIWGALIGVSISTLGSLSNLYAQHSVHLERRGQVMSILHAIYGLCSFLAPLCAGIILINPDQWRLLFMGIAPLALGSLILVRNTPTPQANVTESKKQSVRLQPIHMLAVSVMIAYVLAEVLTSTWMVSYLVSEHGKTVQEASYYSTVFFAFMFVTRVICGLIGRPPWHRPLIWVTMSLSLICMIVARVSHVLWILPICGIFGPFFPLYITWTSLRFPEKDRTLILWMLSGMQAALGIANTMVGKIADQLGFSVAYSIPVFFLALCLVLLKLLESQSSKQTAA